MQLLTSDATEAVYRALVALGTATHAVPNGAAPRASTNATAALAEILQGSGDARVSAWARELLAALAP